MKRIMVTLTLLFLLLCPILASENGVPGGVGGGEMPISGGGQDEEIIEGKATLRISAYKNAAPKAGSVSMRFSSSMEGGTILRPDESSSNMNVEISMLDERLPELYGDGISIGFFEARGKFDNTNTGTLTTQLEMFPASSTSYDSETNKTYITSIDSMSSYKNETNFRLQGSGGTKTLPMKIERRVDAEERYDIDDNYRVMGTKEDGYISHDYQPEKGLNKVTINFNAGYNYGFNGIEWLFREVYVLKIDAAKLPWDKFRENLNAGTYAGLLRLTATYTTDY